MTLATAVADYVKARTEADAAPVWGRLMQEGIVCARMQELLAACYADNETLADALIDHAPEYVRQQALRWQEMAARLEPAKKPNPIVIVGPWQERSTGAWFRLHIRSHYDGAYVFEGEFQIRGGGGVLIHSAQGDMDDADREARERGWVLLDAEPLANVTRLGRATPLGPWQGDATFRTRRGPMPGTHPIVLVGLSGWSVLAHGSLFAERAAHGPQTGPEGERRAMAAAYALGFVEGT